MSAFASTLVLAGCGAEDRLAEPSAGERTSARFVQTMRYVNEGEEVTEASRGVFDWTERRGWVRTDGGNLIRQVGEDCYEPLGDEEWAHWRLDEPGDLCPLFPPDPTRSLDELLPGADFERLGTEEIAGVQTTHFRAVAGEDAASFLPELDDGPIELWVDEKAGLLHQWRQSNPPSEGLDEVELDYLEFGVAVDVKAPPDAQLVEMPGIATGMMPEEGK